MSCKNIVVLIKCVPDISGVYISKSQQKVIENNPPVINPADEHALEYALSIKDKTNATIGVILLITITKDLLYPVTVYEGILRTALSMGADNAYLLQDIAFLDGDAYSNSYVLAQAIKKISEESGGFDLLVAGKGETGARVAEELGLSNEAFIGVAKGTNIPRIPSALNIIRAAKKDIIKWDADKIRLRREMCGKSGRLIEAVRRYLVI